MEAISQAEPRETGRFTFKKMLEGMDVVGRVTRMTFHYPWRMTAAIGALLAAVAFQLYIPEFLGDAVDNARGLLAEGPSADASRALVITGALLFGTSVLRGLFTMLHNYIGESVGQHIGYELRMAIYDKIQRLDFRYHDHTHSGDLITRGMLDVEGVRLFVNTGIKRMIFLTMLIGVAAYRVLSADLLLGVLALSFVPLVGWRAIDARLSLRESWHRLQERLSNLTRVMEENLQGIRVVRAFASQAHEMEKFAETSSEAQRLTSQRIGIRVRNGTFMTFAFFVAMGLVLLVGGQKALAGEITIGQLTEFLAYMTVLQMPVRQLGLLVNSVARATTSGERLFSVLDEEPDIKDSPEAGDLEVSKGELVFDNVSFAYKLGDEEVSVLRDVSFRLERGQTLGIVGPPGAGKSTIAHLIPRFYDVTAGSITIDGQDIRDVKLKSLRQAVNVIQQDIFLFTAGIQNNVAYGNPWADRDRIVSATNVAQLNDYINSLPKKYETLVGERGVSLSGGQRQRLVIARSLLMEPSIMVFDDSTAAIDAATEQRILASLREHSAETAVIIISHRLSSLMHADSILFVDEGTVVEQGTHESLLEQGGRYAALYELQSNPVDESLLEDE
ncbi:MAG: ABC transporter ATP-binding protein [Spirochaetales bacterium]